MVFPLPVYPQIKVTAFLWTIWTMSSLYLWMGSSILHEFLCYSTIISFCFKKYGDEFVVVILYNIKRKWKHLTLSQPIVLDTASTNLPGCPLQIYSILPMLIVGNRNCSKLHTSLEIHSRRFPVLRCIYILYEEKKKIFKSRILLKRITTIQRYHCCWVKYQCLRLQDHSTMRKGYLPLKIT